MDQSPQMQPDEYERLEPHRIVERDGIKVVFATPNAATAWRVDTLFTKEPDTIEWIAGFAAEDVLLDIGANVGMYSLWAARTRGIEVIAFEPESQNYAILNRNIQLNGLDAQIRAYCIALSDRAGYDKLFLSTFGAGGSCHTFGASLDFANRPRVAPYAQGCVAAKLDDLVAAQAVPVPTHIKIDVDGLEPQVVSGARATLADARVRSVLVEINTNLDEHWDVVDALVASGFDYSTDQVELAQRKEGPFKGIGNYVFRR